MNILPYKLSTTNDKLTSKAGLLAISQLMESLQISKRVDQLLPQPKSNRGFKPSVFFQTFILMVHEGSFHLDDIRHLSDDEALRSVLDLKDIPQTCTLGAWLRRMGDSKETFLALQELNKVILKSALHKRKGEPYD